MKGDFSRFTYKKNKNYIGVLKQQGRITLDSDWNEQSEIWRENYRQLAIDSMGIFAIPLSPNKITKNNSSTLRISNYRAITGGRFDFRIGKGLAYVGGYPIRFENDFSFLNQPDYPEPEIISEQGDLLVFIESWVRAVSYIDDEMMREPALGGADTCLRGKALGQIRVAACSGIADFETASEFLSKSYPSSNLTLSVKIDKSVQQIPFSFGEVEIAGGIIPGNLHFRIELHKGTQNNGGLVEGIKWSDDNAATVAPVINVIAPDTFQVEETESVMGEFFREGDWVEVTNLRSELHKQGGQMARIKKLESDVGGLAVILDSDIHPLLTRNGVAGKFSSSDYQRPRLRKWSGYITPLNSNTVCSLGKGIKATIQSEDKNVIANPGDFWNFDIRDREYNKRYAPKNAPPDGIETFRFPLAVIPRDGVKKSGDIIDFRRFVEPQAKQ